MIIKIKILFVHNMLNHNGFTLAETLITLVIIGVIAAITIPSIINSTINNEYVSKLKKTYSIISQATNLIIAEEGPVLGWATNDEKVYSLYEKKLINIKNCKKTRGCFSQHTSGKHTYLNGETDYGNWDTLPSFITIDGIQVGFYFTDTRKQIYIDVNGEKKPNRWGRDVYIFDLEGNNLSPYCSQDNCRAGQRGTGCACRVLREGAINY